MGIQRARNWESSKYNENTTKLHSENTTKYTLSKVFIHIHTIFFANPPSSAFGGDWDMTDTTPLVNVGSSLI